MMKKYICICNEISQCNLVKYVDTVCSLAGSWLAVVNNIRYEIVSRMFMFGSHFCRQELSKFYTSDTRKQSSKNDLTRTSVCTILNSVNAFHCDSSFISSQQPSHARALLHYYKDLGPVSQLCQAGCLGCGPA